MSILLRKVNRIADKPVASDGYLVVNCLSWFPNNVLTVGEEKIPLYEVSPYYLRDPMYGCLFENVWQSCKLYPKVFEQKAQTKWDAGWSHPEEVHVERNAQGEEVPNAAYWKWRERLAKHPQPVRYPNGKDGRHTCKGSIWSVDGKTLSLLSYFQARWHIYVQEYAKCVKTTAAYKQLKALVDRGVKLELLDVDCPASIEVTRETFNEYLVTRKPFFGHTWTLAACLLGLLDPPATPKLPLPTEVPPPAETRKLPLPVA